MNPVPARRICSNCRTDKPTKGIPCGICGSHEETQVLEVGVCVEVDMALALGLVQTTGSRSGGPFRLRFRTPAGTKSDAQIENNRISLSVKGAAEIGRPGEARALRTLLEALGLDEVVVTVRPAEDARGEDAKLDLGGASYDVQIETVPSVSNFWKQARGSTHEVVQTDTAIRWLHDAMVAKYENTSPAERIRTLLVLDAAHVGVLAANEVVEGYIAQHGDPGVEFGFAAVWLVGPTASSSTQIGVSNLIRRRGLTAM